jgi:hypothetical protein
MGRIGRCRELVLRQLPTQHGRASGSTGGSEVDIPVRALDGGHRPEIDSRDRVESDPSQLLPLPFNAVRS